MPPVMGAFFALLFLSAYFNVFKSGLDDTVQKPPF